MASDSNRVVLLCRQGRRHPYGGRGAGHDRVTGRVSDTPPNMCCSVRWRKGLYRFSDSGVHFSLIRGLIRSYSSCLCGWWLWHSAAADRSVVCGVVRLLPAGPVGYGLLPAPELVGPSQGQGGQNLPHAMAMIVIKQKLLLVMLMEVKIKTDVLTRLRFRLVSVTAGAGPRGGAAEHHQVLDVRGGAAAGLQARQVGRQGRAHQAPPLRHLHLRCKSSPTTEAGCDNPPVSPIVQSFAHLVASYAH
jgi:hypothetical protein